jgi:hypothetical protein
MTPSLPIVFLMVSLSAPGAEAAREVAAPRDFNSPPPGASPADQALWRRAHYVNIQIPIERAYSTRLQAQARGNAYDEQLTALANAGALQAKRAEDLKNRLYAKWAEIANLLTQQWPVDPRLSCRPPLLVFEGVLFREDSPGKRAQLDDTRRILQSCVERGTVPLEAVAKANVQFEAILAEADRAIADAHKSEPRPGDPAAASAVPAAAPDHR